MKLIFRDIPSLIVFHLHWALIKMCLSMAASIFYGNSKRPGYPEQFTIGAKLKSGRILYLFTADLNEQLRSGLREISEKNI